MRHEITGTVRLQRGESDDCICCEGSHIYGTSLDLGPFETDFPEHFGRGVRIWLESMFEYKDLEGREIKITAELLGEPTAVKGA